MHGAPGCLSLNPSEMWNFLKHIGLGTIQDFSHFDAHVIPTIEVIR